VIDLKELELTPEELEELIAVSSTGARTSRPYPPTWPLQLELIPISSIIIHDRQRGDKLDGRDEDETIKSLEDSFERHNRFGAIIVHKGAEDRYRLVCGRRRIEASKRRGDAHIPAQFVVLHPDDPNPEATLQSLELIEDAARLQRDSLNKMNSRAKIAETYLTEGKSQKEAAELLGIRPQYLSNTLADAQFYRSYPEKVKHCKTQDDVKKVREKHERAWRQEEDERLWGRAKTYEIVHADFNVWAPAYSGPLFNLGYIDFPYGIGQDKFGQKSRTDETYEDRPEVANQLWATLETYQDRLFSKDAHLIVSFSMTQYQALKDRLERMGWEVNATPFAWVKPSAGIIPRPGRDLRQCWEPIFICARGDRKVEGKRNWYPGDPPRGEAREHQSEKNEEMMQHLLSAFVTEDTRLLDPTCGSGVAIRVAKRLKAAYALGLEISEQNALRARAGIEKVKLGEPLKVNCTLEDLGL
jgi:hypothetical protein